MHPVGVGRSMALAALAAVGVSMSHAMPVTGVTTSTKTRSNASPRYRAPRFLQQSIPDLNRSPRHPTVQSYKEAAELSSRMGYRSRPRR